MGGTTALELAPGVDVLVLKHEPYIAALAARLRQQGVNRSANAQGRRSSQRWCVRPLCPATAFPADLVHERCRDVCDRPGPRDRSCSTADGCARQRIVTNSTGQRVDHLFTESRKGPIAVRGAKFVLAAGAVNSAALQLTSANDTTRVGLANSSDQVGRNFMMHDNAHVVVDLDRPNDVGTRRDRVGHRHRGSRPTK